MTVEVVPAKIDHVKVVWVDGQREVWLNGEKLGDFTHIHLSGDSDGTLVTLSLYADVEIHFEGVKLEGSENAQKSP